MKKTFIFLLTFILIISNISYAETLDQADIQGEAAILIDELTGQVLFEKNPDKKMYPASTTKILTAIIILENHDITEEVTIDKDSPHTDGKRIYLVKDEKLTVEQLLYALMVESANDAALALARYHAGSVEAFCEIMNAKAKSLGAVNSNFVNPNGLHDPEHYSTARDLALIGQYAFKNDTFKTLVKTGSYTIPPTEKQDIRNYIRSTNRFLGAKGPFNINYKGQKIPAKYEIVDGIKTGWTGSAGFCLVSTGKIDAQRYIGVVLKAPNEDSLYIDSRTLLDYGFENFIRHSFVSEGAYIKTIQIPNADNITVNVVAGQGITKMIDSTIDINQIETLIQIKPEIKAPIAEGQELGVLTFNYQNRELAAVPIISEYEVSTDALLSENVFSLIVKDENNQLDWKFYINILFRLAISFVIYRAIITAINLRKRKKRLEL